MYNTVFLDAGHGGIKDGRYTTSPKKLHKHFKGEFHEGRTFYEGVKNRQVVNFIVNHLNKDHPWINVFVVNDYIEDTPLKNRVVVANYLNDRGFKGIYVSEHSNAFNTSVKGIETHVTGGESSLLLEQEFNKAYKNISEDNNVLLRSPKKSKFYVLRKTKMPAILLENLFFDNHKDAAKLMDTTYLNAYALEISKAIANSLNKLNEK